MTTTTAHLDAAGNRLTVRDLLDGRVVVLTETGGGLLFRDREAARAAIYGGQPETTTHVVLGGLQDGLRYTLTAVNGRRYRVRLDSLPHAGGRFFPDREHAHHWVETGEWLTGDCPWMAGRGVEAGPNEVTLAKFIDRSFGPDSCINRTNRTAENRTS